MFKSSKLAIAFLLYGCIAQAGLVDDVLIPLVGQGAVNQIVEKVGPGGAENIARAAQESISQVGRLTTQENIQIAVEQGGDIVTNLKSMILGAWSFVPDTCRDASEVIAGSARVINSSTSWLAERPRFCFFLGAAAIGGTLYYGVPWLYRRLRGPEYIGRGRKIAANLHGTVRGIWG